MTIPSNCHTSDREWKPERESLANAIARLGLQPPTFDRQSFVRVMHLGRESISVKRHDGVKVHWHGATNCPSRNASTDPRNMAVHRYTVQTRTFSRNQFKAYPEQTRCQYCNEALKAAGEKPSPGGRAHLSVDQLPGTASTSKPSTPAAGR